MIINKTGDLLEQDDIFTICHVANLHHVMGAGIARTIREKYPEAYDADLRTEKDSPSKLGKFSKAFCKDKLIINIYAMPRMGELCYTSLYKALINIRDGINTFIDKRPDYARYKAIGVPFNMGCGLAGGNWNIVSKILDEVFANQILYVVEKIDGQ